MVHRVHNLPDDCAKDESDPYPKMTANLSRIQEVFARSTPYYIGCLYSHSRRTSPEALDRNGLSPGVDRQKRFHPYKPNR